MKIQINVKDNKVVHQPLVYLSAIHVAKCFSESIGKVWRWTNDNPNFPTAMHLSKESTRWKLQNLEILEAAK